MDSCDSKITRTLYNEYEASFDTVTLNLNTFRTWLSEIKQSDWLVTVV